MFLFSATARLPVCFFPAGRTERSRLESSSGVLRLRVGSLPTDPTHYPNELVHRISPAILLPLLRQRTAPRPPYIPRPTVLTLSHTPVLETGTSSCVSYSSRARSRPLLGFRRFELRVQWLGRRGAPGSWG